MTNRSEYASVECVNIPKMLFQEKQYEKLSVDAKLLYSLLLDRKTLANMNGWIDQNGTAYVVYPKSEMKKHLNASRYRVDMALEELEKCGQMVVVTQPDPGRPCQIYVKDITGNHEKDMEENAMCMMMKDSNDKNKEPMMGPCMGIPGMHGVAIFFDPEEFMKAVADEEKETDAKDTLVTTITTDDSGLAVAKNLPLGKYLVKEKNAPNGFVLSAEAKEVDFAYADQNTAVIKESVTFTNDRQKVAITVTKQDAENEAVVAGAEFGIYNTSDIKNAAELLSLKQTHYCRR